MSVTKEEIERIALAEDDFGHEMRAGNILRTVCPPKGAYVPGRICEPRHGGTYKDPLTQKPRQFDYQCRIIRATNWPHDIWMSLECKNLNPDFPLVICGRPRTLDEANHVFFQRSLKASAASMIVRGNNSFYKPGDFVGKSVMRLKQKNGVLCSDGDSDIYDKWSQALSSAYSQLSQIQYGAVQKDTSSFLLPLVVVPDKALWIMRYTPEGLLNGHPEQVNECRLYIDHKVKNDQLFATFTHIHFLTLSGLTELLNNFVNGDYRGWDEIFCESANRYVSTG